MNDSNLKNIFLPGYESEQGNSRKEHTGKTPEFGSLKEILMKANLDEGKEETENPDLFYDSAAIAGHPRQTKRNNPADTINQQAKMEKQNNFLLNY